MEKNNKKVMCGECGLREANIEFSREPTLSLSHGFGIQNICRQCYIEKIEKELGIINENLKEQKKLLKEEELNELNKK